MAPLSRLLLFATPLFVLLVGLLAHFRFDAFDQLPLPSYFGSTPSTSYDDKMGGGDGYRSVAYFVNVSILFVCGPIATLLFENSGWGGNVS